MEFKKWHIDFVFESNSIDGKMKINLSTLIGLICAVILGWHYLRGWGVLMALAVFGLLK